MNDFILTCFKKIKESFIYIIICSVFFIVGVVLSLFCHKTEGMFFYINVLERYTFIFDTSMHASAYFLSKVIASLGICIVMFLSGFSFFSLFIHFIIFLYEGFVIGSICPYFFKAFYISGVVVYVIAILPSMVLRVAGSSFYSCLCYNFLKEKSKCNNSKFSLLLLLFLAVFMIYIIACLWEVLVIGLIIKPFNTFF